jgi:hypothetical protein
MEYRDLVGVSKEDYIALFEFGGNVYNPPGTDLDFLGISKNEDVDPPPGFKERWKLNDGFTCYTKPANKLSKKIDFCRIPVTMVEECIKRSPNASDQASNGLDSVYLYGVEIWAWKPVYKMYEEIHGKQCAKKILKRYVDAEGVTDVDTMFKLPHNFALNLLMINLWILGNRWKLDVWDLYKKVRDKKVHTQRFGTQVSYVELKEFTRQTIEKMATGLKLDGLDFI